MQRLPQLAGPPTHIYGQRASPDWQGTVPGRHGLIAIEPTRHVVTLRHVALAFGPGTILWAYFYAVLAYKARQKLQAVLAHNLFYRKTHQKIHLKAKFSNLNQI